MHHLDPSDERAASWAVVHVSLDDPHGVARLLDRLRAVGAAEQATELTARLPAAGLFELHPDYGSWPYRFGREPSGRPALAWGWPDLD